MTVPRIDQPVAGFYSLRVRRDGPKVPVRFWCDGDQWHVEVDGERQWGGVPIDPFEVWPFVAGRAISQSDFEHYVRLRVWARMYDPDHPAANPFKPVDLRKMKPRW
jgi:hypothetical protein